MARQRWSGNMSAEANKVFLTLQGSDRNNLQLQQEHSDLEIYCINKNVVCLFMVLLQKEKFYSQHHLFALLELLFTLLCCGLSLFALLYTTSSSFVWLYRWTRDPWCGDHHQQERVRILAAMTAVVSLTWLPQSFQIRLNGRNWNWTGSHSWRE